MTILQDAAAQAEGLVGLRRRLHRTPEIGLTLPRTQDLVLRALDGLGLEITTGSATTSVTAVLRGSGRGDSAGAPSPAVLLRADMDALPVHEASGLEFAATNGAMHACGHDLHTAMLIGAARLLAGRRDGLAGDVVFMFQPGEEGYDGAQVMLDEGVLEAAGQRVTAAFAMHVFSALVPSGVLATRPGSLMSASDGLDVTVVGAGGHGSAPHRAKDPVTAAAEMITAMQIMVTRQFDVFDPVVISVGAIHGGQGRNVIPDQVQFAATVRSFSAAAKEKLHGAIPQLLESIAFAHGLSVQVNYHDQYPPTITDPDETAFAAATIADVFGRDRQLTLSSPLGGSEDFSRVLNQVPGSYICLGATPQGADPDSAPFNHSPQAVFDEGALPVGAALYAELAIRRLADAETPAPAASREAPSTIGASS